MDPDTSGRMPTDLAPAEAPWRAVYPPRREFALDALLRGETISSAGEAAGVTRQTVSGWLNHDPAFAAEYAARRRELRESVRQGLEARAAEAVATLRALLRNSDPWVRIAACRVLVSILAQANPETAPPGDSPAAAARRVLAEEVGE